MVCFVIVCESMHASNYKANNWRALVGLKEKSQGNENTLGSVFKPHVGTYNILSC